MKTEIAKWKKHISSRLLVRERWATAVEECTLMEVSPAGRLKFRWPGGSEQWKEGDEYILEEVLSDPTAELRHALLNTEGSRGRAKP